MPERELVIVYRAGDFGVCRAPPRGSDGTFNLPDTCLLIFDGTFASAAALVFWDWRIGVDGIRTEWRFYCVLRFACDGVGGMLLE